MKAADIFFACIWLGSNEKKKGWSMMKRAEYGCLYISKSVFFGTAVLGRKADAETFETNIP